MKNINLRLPVITACSIALGCLAALLFAYFKTDILYVTAAIAFVAVIFIILLVLRRIRAAVYILTALIFFIAGVVSCYLTVGNYSETEIDAANEYIITGKVADRISGDDFDYIIIGDLTCDNLPVDGKARVYVDKNEICNIGYTVAFNATLTEYDTFAHGRLTYNAAAGIKFSARNASDFQAHYSFDLFGGAKQAIKDTLFGNLSYDTAAVVCAVMLGENELMDGDVLQTFRQGGIAHILAVSGLHIGLIYSAIWFILRRLRFNKYPAAVISVAAVIIYAGVCGFTVSSVRAAIMCAVSAAVAVTGNKYDGLNSLAFSVIIILLINPLSLFTAGFQLSVCAVGGICLTSVKISSLLERIKLPRSVCRTTGATVGAQLGALPAMLSSFGYISGAGLVLNIVAVPLMSLIFAPLFIGVVLSAIIAPVASVIVPCVAAPLEAVISYLVLCNFEDALISEFGAGAFAPVYFIFLLFLSDKINMRRIKRVIAITLALIIAAGYCVIKIFAPFNGYLVIIGSKHGNAVIVKSFEGAVIIVTQSAGADIKNLLNEYYCANTRAVIILGGENCMLTADYLELDCPAYVWDIYPNIQTGGADIDYVNKIELCGGKYTYLDGRTVLAEIDGIEICVSATGGVALDGCNLIISEYASEVNAEYKITFNRRGGGLNAYDCGDIKFEINNGDLICKSLTYSPN